jgi:hypothetical protein
VTSHKSKWDDDYLDQMIMQSSESLVRQRLDSVVQDYVSEERTLVSLTRSAVDRFVRLWSKKRARAKRSACPGKKVESSYQNHLWHVPHVSSRLL